MQGNAVVGGSVASEAGWTRAQAAKLFVTGGLLRNCGGLRSFFWRCSSHLHKSGSPSRRGGLVKSGPLCLPAAQGWAKSSPGPGKRWNWTLNSAVSSCSWVARLPGGSWTQRHNRIKACLSSLAVYCGVTFVCKPYSLFSAHLLQRPLHQLQATVQRLSPVILGIAS